ncbi:MAG: hypothetical protein ABR557_13745 [Pyrinomonadaceae bacterium]
MNMRRISRATILLGACLCLLVSIVNAQSADITRPVPVSTNQVTASIAARDLGDARLTDHFYAFTGTPGDLLITVDSRNMNGDVDVFTAAGLRPLLKFSIYAGGSEPITKSVYLRQRQDLILRVEARTPNDDDAVYRIHFGGAFESIAGGALRAENEDSSAQPGVTETLAGKKGRRVSSVGARIEEPAEPEAVATASREPTPAEATVEIKPETPKTTTAEPPAAESRPAPRRRGMRRGTTARATTPEPEAEPNTGPKLVIETNDGTLIERYMSSVRRVTVDSSLVVIIGKDGKIQRVLLANVVRMTIAP